jgi:hypothetical protein
MPRSVSSLWSGIVWPKPSIAEHTQSNADKELRGNENKPQQTEHQKLQELRAVEITRKSLGWRAFYLSAVAFFAVCRVLERLLTLTSF